MSSPSEDALKEEIARLSGAIRRHKTGDPGSSSSIQTNGYVKPYLKPSLRPALRSSYATHKPAVPPTTTHPPVQPREVVINGVAFQSSKRSLVRKDLVKSPSAPTPPSRQVLQPYHTYARKYPGSRAPQRPYKSKASRRFPQNHNMTLDNGRKPVRVGRKTKSMKYVDKQCPRFSTTGVCTKGLTCSYKHDTSKIAVCWLFLNGNCPNTAESCSLSHDPTPERTPLCVHFANNGRCKNGNNCLFPHVRVGPRTGVCRGFAVLGHCDKGIDCEHQHVRECPDFAEKGACPNPRCKLPHVIRANKRRADAAKLDSDSDTAASVVPTIPPERSPKNSGTTYGNDANIGDEYISLTFHESEESDVVEDDSEEEDRVDADSNDEEGDNEDASADEAEMEVHL